MYLSLGISVYFSSACEAVSGAFLDAVLVILSATLLSIKLPNVSPTF